MFKKGLKVGFIVGAILSIIAIGFVYYVSHIAQEQSDNVSNIKNFKELDISFRDLEGNAINLDEYKDKTILINIWGTWCAPCVKEMPLLQEVYNEVKDKYVFIMISDEEIEKVSAFIDKNNYNFKFAISDEKLNASIGVFPSTFILDSDQNVIYFKAGSFEEYTKQSFKELLIKTATKNIIK